MPYRAPQESQLGSTEMPTGLHMNVYRVHRNANRAPQESLEGSTEMPTGLHMNVYRGPQESSQGSTGKPTMTTYLKRFFYYSRQTYPPPKKISNAGTKK